MVLWGSLITHKLVSDNCSIPERFIARWYKELPIMKSSQHVDFCVECVWNLMAHGDAREGKWRGNWRLEWVASTLILPRNVVCPALLTLMHTPRLPAVDWTDAPADLNGFVRFGERRNLVSAPVLSRFKRTIPTTFVFVTTSAIKVLVQLSKSLNPRLEWLPGTSGGGG
jgi:hypothetical protein